MKAITPILLAGGIGKRLWPVSRKSFPKQFHKLYDNKTLFQNTLERLQSEKDIIFKHPITITNEDYRFLVLEQFKSLSRKYNKIFLEPFSKNTAAAVLVAAIEMYKSDKNSVLLMTPTDHVIPDISTFHSVVKVGFKEIKNGNIVIFGIKPSRAETGYGYIKIVPKNNSMIYDVIKFVEKPSLKVANKMFSSGNYFWNSGIMMFRSKDLIDAFKKNQKEIYKEVKLSLENGKEEFEFFKLDALHWNKCKNISVDHAILEKVNNLKVIPFKSKWSDLGDWKSVWEEKKWVRNNYSNYKNVTSKDCKNIFLENFSSKNHLVALGLENIIAVSTDDAVLIADKSKSQEVKGLVDSLKEKKVIQAEVYAKDFRPWGWFEILSFSKFYKVKKILVNPFSSLSLQSHKFRSEHWIIIEGKAKITIDNKVQFYKKNESVYIPIGAIHRLENKEKKPLIIIEVQSGSYLEEDDITRYDDIYGRSKK